ncbi:hypothetical protein ABT010_34835 [Streptomyces sp. NPDC002668]|uniref:hypothetical protein n=1 Tax=Streptomyces sp. NPDC002668 TaxID=3154422 RepID=UPI003334517B
MSAELERGPGRGKKLADRWLSLLVLPGALYLSVADAFYTRLKRDPNTLDTSQAAYALHHAIRAVRDGHDLPDGLDRTRTPSLWAAYLHAGA